MVALNGDKDLKVLVYFAVLFLSVNLLRPLLLYLLSAYANLDRLSILIEFLLKN